MQRMAMPKSQTATPSLVTQINGFSSVSFSWMDTCPSPQFLLSETFLFTRLWSRLKNSGQSTLGLPFTESFPSFQRFPVNRVLFM